MVRWFKASSVTGSLFIRVVDSNPDRGTIVSCVVLRFGVMTDHPRALALVGNILYFMINL
jgi:hypothetical protein